MIPMVSGTLGYLHPTTPPGRYVPVHTVHFSCKTVLIYVLFKLNIFNPKNRLKMCIFNVL